MIQDNKYMPELVDQQDRLYHMQHEAAKVEETDYRIALTPEELDQKRE